MGIREDLLALLRSPEVMSIDFSFRSTPFMDHTIDIHINQISFRKVIYAIEMNRIHVSSDPNLLGAGADGTYHPRNNEVCGVRRIPCANTLVLPPLTDYTKCALAVHESVHASFDTGRFMLPSIDDEVAAYIAQTFYMVRIGQTSTHSTNPIHIKALEIAILNHLYGGIDATRLAELRVAIAQHPSYSQHANTVQAYSGV